MKNKCFAMLGILAVLAATSAFGEQRLTVDIPFEFRVGASVMPAGHYDVNPFFNGNPGTLFLRCHECRSATFARTVSTGSSYDPPSKDRLVFNKYGETYFLSAVWSSSIPLGSVLPKSKEEREIGRRASLPEIREVVVVGSR